MEHTNNWHSESITINGLNIHYYRTGGDKPPIVLNHGGCDDGLCWARVAKALEADYDVVLPDARGHGKSDSGKGDYSTEALYTDLAELIEKLGLEKPVLGGHSMGAEPSLKYAASYPDEISGLFIEDYGIMGADDRLRLGPFSIHPWHMARIAIYSFQYTFGWMPPKLTRPFVRKMFSGATDEEIMLWLEAKAKFQPDFPKAVWNMFITSTLDEQLALFEQISVPVLLFIGDEEQMSFSSPDAVQKIMEQHENVKSVHLANASHFMRFARFDGFMPALQTFLEDVQQKNSLAV